MDKFKDFIMPNSTYGLEQKIVRFFDKKGLNASIALNYKNDGNMNVSIYPEYTDDLSVDIETPLTDFDFKYNGETPSQVYKIYLKNK